MAKNFAADNSLSRRSFVSRSLVLGAGVGLAALPASGYTVDANVECQASAADSLLVYIDLLMKVQSQAFVDAGNIIVPATRNCYKTLDALYEKVEQLQAELRRTPTRASAQVDDMKNLVAAGRAQANAMSQSFAHVGGMSVVLATTFDAVRQKAQAAQELPAGKITLSPRAKKLLEEVVQFVRDWHDVPQQTSTAADKYQQRVTEISQLVSEIRDDLFAASAAAADADLSKSPAAAQAGKTVATQKIEDACTKIERLKPPANTTRKKEADSVSADLMIQVLRGTQRAVGQLNASMRSTNHSTMINAGWVVPTPSNYSRVQQALDMHCPRGTPWKTLHCLTLILGPLAYPDTNTRASLISGVLVLFPCANGDRAGLASALAAI